MRGYSNHNIRITPLLYEIIDLNYITVRLF